jgi:uncharacterized protein (DUF488 family)
MYYRRKVILALLQVFEGRLKKIDFQKLLFLFSTHQDIPSFKFVPYKYGCFSFQSYYDIRIMKKYGLIHEESELNNFEGAWVKNDEKDYFSQLKKNDQLKLNFLKSKFEKFASNDLICYTYKNYPFYAINSKIAGDFLDKKELEDVHNTISHSDQRILFTIGYEGLSLEEYLNKLLINNIKVLCDIRKNPQSMKYGFSRNQLNNACSGVGIEYVHIPELGIESRYRQNLSSQKDYDMLFEKYRNTTLESSKLFLNKIEKMIQIKNRIALTCFEANQNQCHRKQVADKLVELNNGQFKISHI